MSRGISRDIWDLTGISLVIHSLTSDHRRPAVAVLMRPHWSKNHLDGNPIGEVSNDQTRDRKHDVVHASHIFQEQIHQHLHQTQQESHECSNPLDESQLIHSHWSKHLHHHPRIVHKGVYGHLLQIQNGTDVAPEFHHSIAETCLRHLSGRGRVCRSKRACRHFFRAPTLW